MKGMESLPPGGHKHKHLTGQLCHLQRQILREGHLLCWWAQYTGGLNQ